MFFEIWGKVITSTRPGPHAYDVCRTGSRAFFIYPAGQAGKGGEMEIKKDTWVAVRMNSTSGPWVVRKIKGYVNDTFLPIHFFESQEKAEKWVERRNKFEQEEAYPVRNLRAGIYGYKKIREPWAVLMKEGYKGPWVVLATRGRKKEIIEWMREKVDIYFFARQKEAVECAKRYNELDGYTPENGYSDKIEVIREGEPWIGETS